MKWITKNLLLILILAGLAFLHLPRLGDFPVHTHAWTQSDRIALSYCYVDNSLDFFHPCTNSQETVNGITAVDFPILEYIAAIGMTISGVKSPFYLQLLNLLSLLLGFYFLRKLAFNLGISRRGALVIASFFAFSPFIAYYSAGSIPSILALSSFIAGLYYLEIYFRTNRKMELLYASLFLSLAVLVRKPYVLHVFGLLPLLAFLHWKKLRSIRQSDALFLLIPLLFFSWYIWTKHLENNFGSIFLGEFMMASNVEAFLMTLIDSISKWRFDYLTQIQYAWLAMLLGANLWQQKGLHARSKPLANYNKWLFISAFVYAIMMIRQFEHHDYYMMDAVFPALLLVTVNLYPKFRESFPGLKKWFAILGLMAIIFWAISTYYVIQKRNQSGFWNRIDQTYQNFSGAEQWLDAHISKEELLLIPDAYTTNTALLLSGRKGFVTVLTNDSTLNELLKKPANYMVVQDQYFLSDVVKHRPSLIQEFTFVASNGNISLYKRDSQEQSIFEFLGMDAPSRISSVELKASQKGTGEIIDSLNIMRLEGKAEFNYNFEMKNSRLYIKHGDVQPKNQSLYWVMMQGERSVYYEIHSNEELLISLEENSPRKELYLWNPSQSEYTIELSEFYAN